MKLGSAFVQPVFKELYELGPICMHKDWLNADTEFMSSFKYSRTANIPEINACRLKKIKTAYLTFIVALFCSPINITSSTWLLSLIDGSLIVPT